MAMKKTHDLAVKIGSYTNTSGETKNRYTNVGSVLQNDDGSEMILINKYINFAGLPGDPERDSIIVSKFVVGDAPTAKATNVNELKDDIPF